MKGVILAGGTGTRLRPCTEVTNKHLLPVYDWPMLFYPINTLKGGGVDDICIVVGGNSVGDIVSLCGDGSRFGVRLTYKYQKGAGGIAEALALTRDFVGGEDVAVILGDNIFLDRVQLDSAYVPSVFVTEHPHPEAFGCVEFSANGGVDRIVEKPKNPPSNTIVTGLYIYNGRRLYDLIDKLEYSDRGELEITDLNNLLNEQVVLEAIYVSANTWYDAGSVESILRSGNAAKKHKECGSFIVHFPVIE